MFYIIVLFFAITGANGQTTLNIQNCTDNTGYERPINLYIEGCSQTPCQLPQLQDAILNIVFRAPRTMRTMTTLAGASVLIGSLILPPIPYPLGEQAITCNNLENTYCPVLATEVVQYKLSMYIDSFMAAGTNVIAEFYVVDENRSPVFCARIPLLIVSANNNRRQAHSSVVDNV